MEDTIAVFHIFTKFSDEILHFKSHEGCINIMPCNMMPEMYTSVVHKSINTCAETNRVKFSSFNTETDTSTETEPTTPLKPNVQHFADHTFTNYSDTLNKILQY